MKSLIYDLFEEKTRRNFIGLSRIVTFDNRLSPTSLRLIHVLMHLFNNSVRCAFPSEIYLAKQLDVTPRSIRNAVRQLEDLGYLAVDRSQRLNKYIPRFSLFVEKDSGK